MHQYLINASIQMLPITTQQHPYTWVDEVINIIAQSGLAYQVGPFSTSVEGSFEQVHQLIAAINGWLVQQQCPEWMLQVQYQLRSQGPMEAMEKMAKYI
ncbi:MAG TPA: thiamine-binding protein [Phnomibacter sp.]|nr:thiamine-binding protein [Phnomibacter sp.]